MKKNILQTLVATSLICGFTQMAQATQDDGFYALLQGNVNKFYNPSSPSVSSGEFIRGETADNTSETGFKIGVGKDLSRFFAIEGAIVSGATYTYKTGTIGQPATFSRSYEQTQKMIPMVSGLFKLPLGSLSIIGKLNAMYAETETNEITNSGTAVSANKLKSELGFGAGIGLELKINSSIRARVDYDSVPSFVNHLNQKVERAHINAGITYSF